MRRGFEEESTSAPIMSEESLYLPGTMLRRSYERSRSIDHAQQIEECADLLAHPELLVSELLDAYAVIESFGESELDVVCNLARRDPQEDSDELVLDHFFEGQEVCILGVDGSGDVFRCLATDVRPVPELIPADWGGRDGFDYIAEPTAAVGQPILGVAQSQDDRSAYPVLLRLLCCLTELAPAQQLNVVNTDCLKGSLQPDSRFDLHMVLWDEGGLGPMERALCELARDLAEKAREGMASCPPLARRVGRIRCMRMDPRRFQGELEEMWAI